MYKRSGELSSVTLPDATVVSYEHDVFRRPVVKKVDCVVVEKYLWAGLTQLLAVYDGTNGLVARFEYADGRMPVKMVQASATYYLAYDQVGSLRAVLDTGGAIVHEIAYDAWGNILAESSGGLTLPFGFAGGLHDRDTGLVRFGFRDYDPDSGRWTAKDPIGFSGGPTMLYAYCSNDPLNHVDPEGPELRWSDAGSILLEGGWGAVQGLTGVGDAILGSVTFGCHTPSRSGGVYSLRVAGVRRVRACRGGIRRRRFRRCRG